MLFGIEGHAALDGNLGPGYNTLTPSSYHFYDGLWYDLARAQTHDTLTNKPTQRCRFYLHFL